jgi:hypothetical protein
MASEEKIDAKQGKRSLDVMTVVKRLPLLILYTIFLNYIIMLFSVGLIASFIDLRTISNTLPIYMWELPLTFILLLWLMRKKNDDES